MDPSMAGAYLTGVGREFTRASMDLPEATPYQYRFHSKKYKILSQRYTPVSIGI